MNTRSKSVNWIREQANIKGSKKYGIACRVEVENSQARSLWTLVLIFPSPVWNPSGNIELHRALWYFYQSDVVTIDANWIKEINWKNALFTFLAHRNLKPVFGWHDIKLALQIVLKLSKYHKKSTSSFI